MISRIFTQIVDLLFPRECARCGEGGALLCSECLLALPRAPRSTHTFITALYDYHDPAIRNVILKFKYKNARGVAKLFSTPLYEEIIGDIGESLYVSKSESYLLVPIPLHKKRLHERGYNQSELLAREMTKLDTEKLFNFTPKALMRTKRTKPQAKSVKRVARFENLRGAFSANAEVARGKQIILIDDVTTTGATLSDARRALLKAGARSVIAYTLAH